MIFGWDILRFELKTLFSKSMKISQKQGINFDELSCNTLVCSWIFFQVLLSLKSAGTKVMTILHSFLVFFDN